MFTNSKPEPTELDLILELAFDDLKGHASHSDEYAKIMDQIVKMNKMKEEQRPRRVSPDTLAVIAANLVGILMILKHERVDIITSKALPMVMKPR